MYEYVVLSKKKYDNQWNKLFSTDTDEEANRLITWCQITDNCFFIVGTEYKVLKIRKWDYEGEE